MYTLIGYPVGVIVEAVLLAKAPNRMRFAAAGFPDVFELRRSGSQWLTETGQPVEIEFILFSARQGECSSKPALAGAAGAAVS